MEQGNRSKSDLARVQNLASLVSQMHLQNFSMLSPNIFANKEVGHPGKGLQEQSALLDLKLSVHNQ
jgi:hypothetical protein